MPPCIGASLLLATSASLAGQTRAVARGLFDLTQAEHRIGLGVARIFDRPTHEDRYRPGLELRWADELIWRRSAFVMQNGFGSSLRLLHEGYALSLGQSEGLSGIRLGPVELVGGLGLSWLNGSWGDDGLGFGMLWPRSSAGLRFGLGAVRVDVLAHVEYLWNWLGADRFVRGFGLRLSLPGAPVKPPFE